MVRKLTVVLLVKLSPRGPVSETGSSVACNTGGGGYLDAIESVICPSLNRVANDNQSITVSLLSPSAVV